MFLLSELQDILFPRWCCGCNKYGVLLCEKCFSKLEFSTTTETKFKYLDAISSLVTFEPVSKALIHQLKYNSVKEIAKLCARLMFMYGSIPSTSLITSIPLHPIRQCHRGFNQAEEIARELALLHKRPYFTMLKRTRNSDNLASVADSTRRSKIIENQFELLVPLTQYAKTTSVLIIDDVWTSGATLAEAAKILRQKQIGCVYGMTFAHGG